MKKYSFVLYVLVFILGLLIGLNMYDECDVNRDGKVSSLDYGRVKNEIMKNK